VALETRGPSPPMKPSPVHFAYAASAYLTTLVMASPVAAAIPTAKDDKTPLHLPSSDPARESAVSSSGGSGIGRMIVGLAVVIGVIYGLSWVLKQVKASKEGSAAGAGLATISSLPLGPGRSVHLVRAGTDLVLLGAAEKGITPIRSYTEDEARAAGLLGDEDVLALPAPRPVAQAAAASFVQALRNRTVRK
jgi:flagellar protein FliO/FliZ